MSILTVGSGQQYGTLSAAIAASHDGDTIDVQAGTYVNDFATIWTKVHIVGVGGMVHLVATQSPPNGKAILTTETDITLDHIEFSGAAVPDGNGAGVRYEGGNLTITNSYFHDNQEGILAAAVPNGSITIDHSEFANNGTETGYTHNIYINEIGNFTLTNSYIHDALGGHEVKSRADVNVIENNRIYDNGSDASYSIDLPNGGAATIQNNVIQQGPNSPNGNIIAFSEESSPYANSQLSVSGNTIVNERSGFAQAVWNNTGSVTAQIVGNQFYGLNGGQIASGPNQQSGNGFLSSEPALDTSHPWSDNTANVTTAITGLYSAVFNRAPDAAGLLAWEAAAANGMSLQDIANGFVGSAEFHSLYPNMASNAFLTELYQEAFNRAPDAQGMADWTNALQHGGTAVVLLGFATSAENIAKMTSHGWLLGA
jgi:hypothetical protein